MSTTQQITISPRFFATEKARYSNWKTALVRELSQNMLDSPGCTEIHFSTNNNTIVCRDNGRGMSRDTVVDKFLALGATGKEDGGGVGGFGVAKALIALSQENYKIKSQDWKLSGRGSSYQIEENEYFRGCEFEIETDCDGWERYISYVLSRCNIQQIVYVNGEIFRNPVHRGRLIREMSFASVYVNKSADPGLHVRVAGVWMFSRGIEKARVCVEIHPDISRKVLTSSRDSLQYEQQKELDLFLSEIASESRSALKDKTRQFVKIVNRGTGFLSRAIKKASEVVYTPKKEADYTLGSGVSARQIIKAYSDSPIIGLGGYDYSPLKDKEFWETDPIIQGSILMNLAESPEIAKAAEFYDPAGWKGTETRYKLLSLWYKITKFVCDKAAEKYKDEFVWGIGWVFDDSGVEAMCSTQDGLVYFLLNPLDEERKIRYSINKKADILELLSLACHEVAHKYHNRHDEDFANTMTDLSILCLRDLDNFFKTVK